MVHSRNSDMFGLFGKNTGSLSRVWIVGHTLLLSLHQVRADRFLEIDGLMFGRRTIVEQGSL